MVKIVIAVTSFALLSVMGCSREKKKYDDVKQFFNDLTKHQENQIEALDKVKSGKDAAAAFRKNREILTGMINKGREFEAKYPELKDITDLPDDLKGVFARLDDISKKYIQKTMKIMEIYANDPDVKNALNQ